MGFAFPSHTPPIGTSYAASVPPPPASSRWRPKLGSATLALHHLGSHLAGGWMSISRRDFVKTTAALTPALIVPFRRAPTPAGDGFDYVIAGAGHNSLVCAAYLAK